jgi:hypothetical protein
MRSKGIEDPEIIRMKNRFIGLLILSTLILSLSTAAFAGAETVDAVIVVQMKGALDADDNLKAAMSDITNVEWKVVLGELTAADITGADMLIMIQVDPATEFTDAELNLVKNWFDGGAKLLWVPSDSDFGDGQSLRIGPANAALAAVGSKLRGENAEIEDPVSNAGATYRCYGMSENCDPEVSFLVDDVKTAQFHGCGIIIGYVGGTYYALDETSLENVYVIMASSDKGIVVDVTAPPPEAHAAGQEGHLCEMALEIMPNNNLVIATADSPFDHYSAMYKPDIQNAARYGPASPYPQQGAKLFSNIVNYMIRNKLNAEVAGYMDDVASLMASSTSLQGQVTTLTSEKTQLQTSLTAAQSSASTMQIVAVAALVVGVVAGYFVGPMIKKH